MHIAFYARAWPLGHVPLGVVTYVHCMRAALQEMGHRVSVFADLVAPGCTDPDVHVVAPGRLRRLKDRVAGWAGAKGREVFGWGDVIADVVSDVHRRTPIDILEMEEAFGWCAAVQRRLPFPVLVKLHGPAFLTELGTKSELPLTLERVEKEGEALAHMAAIVSPSRCTLNAVAARYGIDAARMEHVPNPLPIPGPERLWHLDGCNPRSILFVGRFDWIKGGDVVISAFAKLLDRFPDLSLTFVGPDNGLTDPDTGETSTLESYCIERVGHSRMGSIQRTGKLPSEEVQPLRQKSLVTMVASRWENQSYAVLESMAQGCPTISTDTGGMPEIVDHGTTGLLCRPGDPDSLAQAISTLLEDTSLCLHLARNAREAVLAGHAPAVAAQRMMVIYEQTVARFSPTRLTST